MLQVERMRLVVAENGIDGNSSKDPGELFVGASEGFSVVLYGRVPDGVIRGVSSVQNVSNVLKCQF
jgi:hypothetical protein